MQKESGLKEEDRNLIALQDHAVGLGHARAETSPGGLGESRGLGLSVSEALDSSSSSSVCSALWYSMRVWVLWVMVMVQGPWAHGSPSTCMGILELLRTSWRGKGRERRESSARQDELQAHND